MRHNIAVEKLSFCEEIPGKMQYLALHKTTGWNAKGMFSQEQLYEGICNSWYQLAVYDEQQLIGFGRIISDGVYQTFICDVMIHPSYQGKGVGTKLMHALVKHCEQQGIRWVQLFCAQGKQPFYEKLGFKTRDAEAPGMTLFFTDQNN